MIVGSCNQTGNLSVQTAQGDGKGRNISREGFLIELGVSGGMKLGGKWPVENLKPQLGIECTRWAKTRWEGDGYPMQKEQHDRHGCVKQYTWVCCICFVWT